MNDYAEAINAEVRAREQEALDYGRLLAQAGMQLHEVESLGGERQRLVHVGYAEQLQDFPNG